MSAPNFGRMDDAQVHRWLCHPGGEPCPDGCNAAPVPARLAAYQDASKEAAENVNHGDLVVVRVDGHERIARVDMKRGIVRLQLWRPWLGSFDSTFYALPPLRLATAEERASVGGAS